MFITTEHIFLRAVEKSDLETLYRCENDLAVWKVSNTQTPFSKYVLEQYLESSHHDIYTNKQLRLMICLNDSKESIGTVDLFEFDPAHARIGVGVMVFEAFRHKGYAFEALEGLKGYAFDVLMVNQLFCHIGRSNEGSIKLFERLGFENTGVKKQWNKISADSFEDELIFQLIR